MDWDWLTPFTFWHWLTLGVALIIAEALLPGVVLLWFGLGALVTGIGLWIDPAMDWRWQLLVFSVVSVALLLLFRRRLLSRPTHSEQPMLNERGMQYIGRRGRLLTPIVGGVGRMQVGDSSWRVTGPEMSAGRLVEVVAVDGVTLRVAAVAEDVAQGDA